MADDDYKEVVAFKEAKWMNDRLALLRANVGADQ